MIQHKLLSQMMIVSNTLQLHPSFTSTLQCSISKTGGEIGFEQVTYNVEEDIQSVRVCVISSVELERAVSVDIVMNSGSAGSECIISNQNMCL